MSDEPTELTIADIDNFVQKLLESEIKRRKCCSCDREHIQSYGDQLGECDECHFSRWQKDRLHEFFRSFLM